MTVSTAQTPEDHLMRSAISGDDRAMERLYGRLSPALYNYLRRLGCRADDADDLLQSVFLSAWRSRESYRGTGIRLWLFTITRNAYFSFVRKRSESGDAADPVGGDRPDEMLEADDLGRVLERQLAKLPDDTREALVLSRISGLSIADIAGLLETSEANIRVRLHRGLTQLKAELPR